MTKKDEPTQPTRPKRGKPIDIPVPKREDVLGALRKVAKPKPSPDRESGPKE